MNATIFQIIFYTLRMFHPKLRNLSVRIPLQQARLESGNWTSDLYKRANNMFGMMAPAVRETAAQNKGGTGYATYLSPLDSIRDYLLYCEAFELYTDNLLANRLLAGKYATAKDYWQKVSAINVGPDLIDPIQLAAKGVAVAAGGVLAVKVVKDVVK